jgi:hypothetical protein
MKKAKFANIRPGYVPRVKSPTPFEHDEAKSFMQWVRLNEAAHPELKWLFAVPNGGHRGKASAGKAKAEGARKGVPDYQMPVRCHDFVGLVIELKRTAGTYASAEQKEWLSHYAREGWMTAVCKGAGEAIDCVKTYLKFLRVKNPQALG